MNNMKENIFFVGKNNDPVSISAAEFPEPRQNSIYFTINDGKRTCRNGLCGISVYDHIEKYF